MRMDKEILALAEEQLGVVATWQARALGLTRDEVHHLRRSSGWEPASLRVLRRTGAPVDDRQRVLTAVLDASPGAAACGPTAAALWGAPGFRLLPVHVVRPRGISRRRSPLAVVHEVVDLHADHLKVLGGITVVSPSRVVCELAGTHPHRAERVLDRFWGERLLDGRTFGRTVAQMADRGRTGSTLFRELDAARGPGYVPPASSLERRFEEILARHGMPPMRRQVDLGNESWCGRVDFVDAHLPLVVEVQSERYHSSLVDRAADKRRRAGLVAAGAEVVEVWDADVWHRPDHVVTEVERAQRRLRRRPV